MIAALEKGERIEVRGFGSFDIRHMKARQARNPKTVAAVPVESHASIHLKLGLEMGNRVNNTKYRITDSC